MANLTIYLPDDIEKQVRKAAADSHLSVSKWVVDRIGKAVETALPAEFLALAGAFADFPEPDEIRRGYGSDVARESLD